VYSLVRPRARLAWPRLFRVSFQVRYACGRLSHTCAAGLEVCCHYIFLKSSVLQLAEVLTNADPEGVVLGVDGGFEIGDFIRALCVGVEYRTNGTADDEARPA
jgi:hypothetical protein